MVNFNPMDKGYIVRLQFDLVSTKKKAYFLFVVNLIIRTNEKVQKEGEIEVFQNYMQCSQSSVVFDDFN